MSFTHIVTIPGVDDAVAALPPSHGVATVDAGLATADAGLATAADEQGVPARWQRPPSVLAVGPVSGSMETRPLGDTGHDSSVLAFGAIALDPLAQDAATEMVHDVLDRDVTHVDVAPQ